MISIVRRLSGKYGLFARVLPDVFNEDRRYLEEVVQVWIPFLSKLSEAEDETRSRSSPKIP